MKKHLLKIFEEATKRLPYLGEVELLFDTPKIEAHGDLSSNAAMILSKKFKKNPREIASEILLNLDIDDNIISKADIAGPGFINFYFNQSFIAEISKKIIELGDQFGKSKKYAGKKAFKVSRLILPHFLGKPCNSSEISSSIGEFISGAL